MVKGHSPEERVSHAEVAGVLRERGFEPVWLGTQRGMEAKLVPPHQIPIEWVSVSFADAPQGSIS